MKITLTTVSIAAVLAAGVGAFSQSALIEEILTHEKEVTAVDYSAFAADHAAHPVGSTSPRAWMATDAKDVRLRFTTESSAGWDIRYRSATGLTPELLAAGSCAVVTEAPSPALAVDWLAVDPQARVYYCDDDASYVSQSGDVVSGWQGDSAEEGTA
jgi:hypothetical protein